MPHDDLHIATWAKSSIGPDHTELRVDHGELAVPMHGTAAASGQQLATNGEIGADLIRLPAGQGFVPHTHPGHHVLTVVAGTGTITYGGRIHETHAGQTFIIEGQVPHAVGAITDHLIVAVGAPHKRIDSTDRMTPVPYEEVTADGGELTCMICDKTAGAPRYLHSVDCQHCPCRECAGMPG
ncbi:cupin domain-containing protein [Saccharopolyspora spinosa]|uniref:Cupin domain-containing protein n=1 Tax=Saccharopolyspora spinosa TaxID=60894 RepID=A0A2N3Y6G7_SACSN|nr:cupin domain-containing protein [Saccharopolyspora spinosa]PKW18473.1 Cupin domain-containing protein [Saccharopolyspora spinosa]